MVTAKDIAAEYNKTLQDEAAERKRIAAEDAADAERREAGIQNLRLMMRSVVLPAMDALQKEIGDTFQYEPNMTDGEGNIVEVLFRSTVRGPTIGILLTGSGVAINQIFRQPGQIPTRVKYPQEIIVFGKDLTTENVYALVGKVLKEQPLS